MGIGLVGVSFFLYFNNKKLYVYFYLLTLVLGIVNLIDVYYWNMTFGIGPIKFNAIFVTLLIIFLAFNKELLDKMFPERTPEINMEMKEIYFRIGQRSVVRFLHQQKQEQENNIMEKS